jgi:hypothetical protein
MWATCPRSAYSGYHVELHEGNQKHTNPLNCTTRSSDISGYHAEFHEGHGTIGAWKGRGTAWQGNCMETAKARHGMCELASTSTTVSGQLEIKCGAWFLNSTKRSM